MREICRATTTAMREILRCDRCVKFADVWISSMREIRRCVKSADVAEYPKQVFR